ncbi:MAG: ribokinase [Eubacterium sp.]|nr:ribokinase [Eubacterium sp.]
MNKILNFGSLNIDIVYSLDHIVRPGETISSEEINTFCGGKGLNQSVAIARSGLEVYHAGKIGRDGGIIRQALDEAGIKCDFLMESEGRTGNALIQKDKSGQNSIILFGGTNKEITTLEIDNILEQFTGNDILIAQNEISNVPYLLKAAQKSRMKIAFNPSPMEEWIKNTSLEGITWLIINEIEGEDLTGSSKPEEIISRLLKKYPDISVVLTLGKNGVIYADKTNWFKHGANEVEVVDTTAAGDTFLGYFVGSTAKGLDIPTSLKLASLAASLAVSKAGAVSSIPTMEMVNELLKT